MAKGLPYFKFTVTEWLTGDIVYEEFDVQGLFINICALYWQRDGVLTIEDINKRYKEPTALRPLTDRFISVTDGKISIKFLDEQLNERKHISIENSKNGKKGGRRKHAKTLSKEPTAKRPLSESKREPSESKPIRIRKEEEKEIAFDVFRVKYPGTKRGNETEFKNFLKHKDWAEVLPALPGIIDRQIAARATKVTSGAFTPEWKNLQTWINQRCWEEVLSEPAKKIYAYENRPSN